MSRKLIIAELRRAKRASGAPWVIKFGKPSGEGGGGDELVNRSDRDRAGDDLGHRDVTRNLSREL